MVESLKRQWPSTLSFSGMSDFFSVKEFFLVRRWWVWRFDAAWSAAISSWVEITSF